MKIKTTQRRQKEVTQDGGYKAIFPACTPSVAAHFLEQCNSSSDTGSLCLTEHHAQGRGGVTDVQKERS